MKTELVRVKVMEYLLQHPLPGSPRILVWDRDGRVLIHIEWPQHDLKAVWPMGSRDASTVDYELGMIVPRIASDFEADVIAATAVEAKP